MAGTVYWITGLSGAGKTTIGSRLFARLQRDNLNVVFLDVNAAVSSSDTRARCFFA